MDIRKVYQELLNKRLKFNMDKNIIYVFQGFPFPIYQALQDMQIPHLLSYSFEKYIDFNKIDSEDNTRKLLMALMMSKGIKWCYYEEFVALTNTINNFSIFNGDIILIRNNLFENYYPLQVEIDTNTALRLYESNSGDEKTIYKYYSDCKLIGETLYFSYVNRHFDIDTGIKIEEIEFYEENSRSITDIKETVNVSLAELNNIKNKIQLGLLANKRFIVTEHSENLQKELQLLNSIARFLNVVVISKTKIYDNEDNGAEYLPILQKYWNVKAKFRNNLFYKEPESSNETLTISQGTIIADIINQCKKAMEITGQEYSDLIVTAPTGAGKSVLFQIPSIYLFEKYNRVTIVVCPLVALMVDQVKELNDRGINYATYINSSISFEERKERLDGIASGKYSIVYLSPELLLSNDIHALVGKRKVGLIVIDEAHLVTSWGRDFRVDYWFLGDYLEKVRHGSYYSKDEKISVPILCLTATAVFGGKDDIIGDLQNSLQLVCNSEQIYIGYVRRKNIEFIIRHPKKKSKSDKEEKIVLTTKEVENSIENGTKTIIYFPFRSSIDDTINRIKDKQPELVDQLVKYHSGSDLNSLEKNDAYMNFRDNNKIVMLSTKAFGMGVNIPDVKEVYHFAPTGTLADYVQEIGRAARDLDKGYAVTDYLPTDMHFARTLWGLSGLRHYQIQEMIKKLYELYENKRRRNLLFSPDTFNYLFDSNSIELKVKSGLMLLSSDLLEKYHFKVIAVRAKSMFSKQYITVPYEIEDSFIRRYQKYCVQMNDVKPRIKYLKKGYTETTYKSGNVYEMDLASLWETEFSEMTFPKFKFDFFSGKLFDYDKENIVPNVKLTLNYDKGYHKAEEKFVKLADAIQNTFNKIKRKYGGCEFSLKDFMDIFSSNYDEKVRKEYITMLIDLFCYEHVDLFDIPKESWKFIEKRKASNDEILSQMTYCIRTQKYAFIANNLKKYIKQAVPNSERENEYITYLPLNKGNPNEVTDFQLLASILQLFDMATYELAGGKNPEIFVRINDPQKLKRIITTDKSYKNRILTGIEARHKRAITIMNRFMMGDYTNEERWEIIENYFLGHDNIVESKLTFSKDNSAPKKNNLKIKPNDMNVEIISSEIFKEYYTNWDEASEIDNINPYLKYSISVPDLFNATIKYGNNIFEARYIWQDKKVAVIEDEILINDKEQVKSNGWILLQVDNLNFEELRNNLEE